MKNFVVMFLAVMMIVMNTMPAFAATSKYGEDKPLTSRQTIQLIVNAGHKHTYINASNGCRYQLYHSCMDGMVGSTPTNHLSTVTIDGVKYTLRNYGYKNKVCSYANVIKKVSGSTAKTPTPAKKKVTLQKISLNKTSLSINVGGTAKLSVSYSPANTTDSKTVTWSSSKTSVATVTGGKVIAKKAGTAVITAKVGSKTSTCKVTVKAASSRNSTTTDSKADNGSYKSVSDAYTILNTFRTTKSNQWYWNSSNTTKMTTYGLKALTRDTALEKTAKIRAKEAWTMYYAKGRATHTRPNGSSCFTAYPASLKYKGENLAWGQTSSNAVILNPTWGWAETNAKYSGQGHRRNMLDNKFTKVGIACYVKDGKTCWAMCLGN